MNLAKLKAYAPKARQDFIQAVTDRAAHYGLTSAGNGVAVLPMVEKGDGVVIGGNVFPRKVGEQRKALEKRVREGGFSQTMESLAYTWFNRLVAIRFMETHGYLDHGYRVLSPSPHQAGGRGDRLPELLDQAEHVTLPGLGTQTVIDLKMDGTKDAELYRLLLIAQCNALHSIMPFIFPKLDDETELLLPDNLLHTDSLVRSLAREITDEDCASVEVLGWLYQFYIAEKKDAVMARKGAVPTEDIPAVTQIFTPHWIVRYLVENSLGRLWLLNRPGSPLRAHMPYYIEGEVETDFLKIDKPEDIRVVDPAVGSGHMLTYAFDLLYAIYVEEGYSPSDAPRLILENNLCGLDICPRAAQLAALALVLKARDKARRFFQSGNLVQPRILALHDVHFDADELREYTRELGLDEVFDGPIIKLLHQFEKCATFGSLIQPCVNERAITSARRAVESNDLGDRLLLQATHLKVLSLFQQAGALAARHHVVVTNPPYMGTKGMTGALKAFVAASYPSAKADLMTCFMARSRSLSLECGMVGLINLPSWLFLSSFEEFRLELVRQTSIRSLLHLGRGMFGADFGSVSLVLLNAPDDGTAATYRRLFESQSEVSSIDAMERLFLDPAYGTHEAFQRDFAKLPGCPIAYWISPRMRAAFERLGPLDKVADIRIGMATGKNAKYVRYWHEVSLSSIGFRIPSRATARTANARWFPYAKGGEFRRWYGNCDSVVDWFDDGKALQTTMHPSGERIWAHNFNLDQIFRPAICWTVVTIAETGFRYHPEGFIFDAAAGICQPKDASDTLVVLGALNSIAAAHALKLINPTVNLHPGYLGRVPVPFSTQREVDPVVRECIDLATADWNNSETSWDFCDHPLLRPTVRGATLEATWQRWGTHCNAAIDRMQELETQNNRLFIEAYGLADELDPVVPIERITLARADPGGDVAALLSYAVGCMMGRFSLDLPGLIIADAGGSKTAHALKSGEPREALSFVPDEDGIVPVLDNDWFEDDVVARTREFLRVAFGVPSLDANVRFIEETLGKDLRKYFATEFFKAHRQRYRQRPVYWLFSSGKQRAFQCLVYLHRYNESTLARMRTEYVVPLQGRMASRIDQLEVDKVKATSTSNRKRLQKDQDVLKRQQTELRAFEEKLKHAAEQRIRLDLDDGVKVNYGKFGDLLADVDAITGGADE